MITGPTRTIKLARKLRSEMNLPETLLWRELRKRPGSFKFRRQHPAGIYVLDFYCAAVHLAIEVDGQAHDGIEAEKRHETRSNFLRSQHVATLRIPAKFVLADMQAVIDRIVEVCSQRAARLTKDHAMPNVPLHQPAAGPPLRAGEHL